MINTPSNQPSNKFRSILNNMPSTSDHRRQLRKLFRRSRSAKKQHSLALNNADFEMCTSPNETEMLQSMNSPDNHGGENNTNQSNSTTSDDTITDRQTQQSLITPPTSPDKHNFISTLKSQLTSHRHDSRKHSKNNKEKNNGFVLIDHIDVDPIFISNDNNDVQHVEQCEHNEIININDIQLEPTTPVTPHLLPPTQSSLPNLLLPTIDHSNNESDVQATQPGVECVTPGSEETNNHEIQSLSSSSTTTTNSSSSTNSSNNDTHSDSIDSTIFNDREHITKQERDLERITIYEINLNNKRRDYQQELQQNEFDESDFNARYTNTLQINTKLKEELKRLQEEKSRTHSSWSCEICTYINESFIKTGKDVCEMCDGPSPLKRYALIS